MKSAMTILKAGGQPVTSNEKRIRRLSGTYGPLTSDPLEKVEQNRERMRLTSQKRAREWLKAKRALDERTTKNNTRRAKSETVSVLEVEAIIALCSESTPQSVRDDVASGLKAGETLTAALRQAQIALSKVTGVTAITALNLAPVEQNHLEVSAEQVCKQDGPSTDQQAGTPRPVRCPPDLEFQNIKHLWDEIARISKKFGRNQMRKHPRR